MAIIAAEVCRRFEVLRRIRRRLGSGLEMVVNIPVSYTHLDVYKRQFLQQQRQSHTENYPFELRRALLHVRAVSYTHLDVYKRQPNDLAGHGEGSVVVEITIDDKGNIVQKTILQSLGPLVDAKVLAALENWHFSPATRNGVAIPSKQDVYYHFKPRA